MKQILKNSRIQQLIEFRNGYLVIACSSLALNFLLTIIIFMMIGYERVILIPPTLNKVSWVSTNSVSPGYLSSIGIFITELRYNLSPENAHEQGELFLSYVVPSVYDKLNTELKEEEDNLKKNKIAISFDIKGIPEIDAKHLVAKVTGDIHYRLGDLIQETKHVKMKISFQLIAGRLLVNSIEEMK